LRFLESAIQTGTKGLFLPQSRQPEHFDRKRADFTGYESPADIVDKYPQFYWNNVSPHIQTAIDYLNVTSSGLWWIAGLYSNVFRAERELRHSGPQP